MSRGRFGRALTVSLVVVFAASLLATAYVAVDPPRSTNTYSEFYLLGPGGQAKDYPTRLEPGESGTVIVGVTNHEGDAKNYVLRVVDMNATGDGMLARIPRTVSHGASWETNVTLSIEETGPHRVQFQLYKGSASGEPYLTARLWVNVTAAESATSERGSLSERFVREDTS